MAAIQSQGAQRKPIKALILTTILIAVFGVGTWSRRVSEATASIAIAPDALARAGDDTAASRAAFVEAYKVLMHPRCMNCHPAGEAPLQGDDSHVHAQNVQRGADGKGKYALKCSNCHQLTNLPGQNMPPGNPNWQLPPADMKMVFQGKSPRELARQLKDPNQNGHKTLEQILHHVAEDKLVGVGWDPGDGRTKPPLTREEFVRKMREWIDNGAAEPE